MSSEEEKIKICDYCHRPFTKLSEFTTCNHKICTVCLFQRIFIHHINEFQGYEYIHVKCKCEGGELDQSLKDIFDLLERKVETDKKNEADFTKEELLKCNVHHNNYLNYYCVDCYTPVCKICISQITNDHHGHRVLPYGKLKNIVRSDIEILPLKYRDVSLFQQNIDNISKQFVEEVDKNFNSTLKSIDEMIKSAFDFRDSYIKSYKEELSKYIQSFKIIKLFYMNFYSDKNVASNKENPCNNINLLRYINNISYELIGAKLTHKEDVNKKCSEFKSKLAELNKQKTKYLEASFEFSQVPRNYRIDAILSKIHEKQFKSLVELPNERFVTASDYKMKIWKSDDEGKGFKNIHTIDKNVGRVYCLLLIKDGRLLSGALNNNFITVWEESEKEGFVPSQTLTHHDKPIITMAELPDGKIVSGSTDCRIIVWEQNDKKFYAKQKIEVEQKPIMLVITLFDDSIAYTTDDGIIKLWGIDENKSLVQSDLIEYRPTDKLQCHRGKIASMSQMRNGCIVSGGGASSSVKDFHIVIWKQSGKTYKCSQILKGHDADVNSVIELRDQCIASASSDHKIKIWKEKLVEREGKPPCLMYEMVEELTEYVHGMFKLIQLKDDRLCTSSSDGSIILWKNRTGTY